MVLELRRVFTFLKHCTHKKRNLTTGKTGTLHMLMCPGVYSISQSCLNTEFLSLYFFMEHIVELVFYGVGSGKHCSKQMNMDPDLAVRVPRIFHCHSLLCFGQECHSAMTPWSIHTTRLPVQGFSPPSSTAISHISPNLFLSEFLVLNKTMTFWICAKKWKVPENSTFWLSEGLSFGHENIIQLNSFGQEILNYTT